MLLEDKRIVQFREVIFAQSLRQIALVWGCTTSSNALGDGSDENESNFIYSLNMSPNSSLTLPLSATNTIGEIADLEVWIDWNGDSSDTNEWILDINDANTLY